MWITVGANGYDVSRDDGKTWHPIDNGDWNALSLPFVVGPKGRIARLQTGYFPCEMTLEVPMRNYYEPSR